MTDMTSAHQPSHGRRAVRLALRLLAAAVPVLFIALLAFGVLSKAPNTGIDDSLAQAKAPPAPSFALAVLQQGSLGPELSRRLAPALRDGRVALSELRGTAVVLNFWASWCVPCRQEAPLLERTWRQQARPRGVLLLGLDMQDLTTDARDFMRHYGIDYLNIRDPTDAVAHRYGATGVPETFFISRAGRVVGHVIGATDPSQLREGIAAAMAGRVAGARRGGAERPTR